VGEASKFEKRGVGEKQVNDKGECRISREIESLQKTPASQERAGRKGHKE